MVVLLVHFAQLYQWKATHQASLAFLSYWFQLLSQVDFCIGRVSESWWFRQICVLYPLGCTAYLTMICSLAAVVMFSCLTSFCQLVVWPGLNTFHPKSVLGIAGTNYYFFFGQIFHYLVFPNNFWHWFFSFFAVHVYYLNSRLWNVFNFKCTLGTCTHSLAHHL